jgi:hypothetical protein
MKADRFAMAYRLILGVTPLSVRSLSKIAHIRRVHNRDRSANEVKQLYLMGSKRAPLLPNPSGGMI